MGNNLENLISEMSLEEKASICSGLNFWNTKPIERLGIPAIMMTDGPHGLRKPPQGDGESIGIGDSEPATCFPSGAALAASWNIDLVEKVGSAIGEESQAGGVQIVLGPAVNIKRSPLCGRNFEYFSEDPYLTAEMASSHIRGVQSQGVGTSLKHFAANNQEHRRMSVNAVVDERTLREIYLPGFENAVKQSQPWTVMAAYNKLNGTYATENSYLLNDILRNEWGFEGLTISDWMAVNERVSALVAGLDLEMPGNEGYGDRKIIEAVRSGELSIDTLNEAVKRVLAIVFRAQEARKHNSHYDVEQHHQLARRTAAECMVLLKNEDNILPIVQKSRVAVIGEMAKKPRYQGGGSSHIVPSKVDVPWEELIAGSAETIEWSYSQGYPLDSDEWQITLVEEAVKAAQQAECAVLFAGLPDRYESEGYDREHMRMPDNHNRLIEAIAEVQPNLIVVLSNGSPVEMPWLNRVKAVLEAYLGGQASGGAIADLLLGIINPSAKLAETFPEKVKHNPSYFSFPGEGDEVAYREGLLVGYRYFDTKEIKPLFAFGHGLSYTSFAYTEIRVDKNVLSDQETLKVYVTVKNTGDRAGQEIVQLYVRDVASSVMRPEKELKGFNKIHLEAGEEKQFSFTLDKRAFAYYNTELKDWHVESGEFEIVVGSSSDLILLKTTVQVNSTVTITPKFTRNSTMGDLLEDPVGAQIVQQIMQGMGQHTQNLTENNGSSANEANQRMMQEVMKSLPLRSIVTSSKGAFNDEHLKLILQQLETRN